MPKVLNFTPCSAATVDAFTGQVSLLFVMESVQPIGIGELKPGPGEPIPHGEARYLIAPFTVVSHWWRQEGEDDQEFEQRVQIRAPDGREAPFQLPVRFKLTRPFHRVFHRSGLVVRAPGLYWLLLQVRRNDEPWATAAEQPFIVEEIPAQEEPVAEGSAAAGQPATRNS